MQYFPFVDEEFLEGSLKGMELREVILRRRKCKFCGCRIPSDARYCPWCSKRLK